MGLLWVEPGMGISREMGKKPKQGEPGNWNRDWIRESSRNICLQDKIYALGQKFFVSEFEKHQYFPINRSDRLATDLEN